MIPFKFNALKPSASAPSSSAPTPTSATAQISSSKPSPIIKKPILPVSWPTFSASPCPSCSRCCSSSGSSSSEGKPGQRQYSVFSSPQNFVLHFAPTLCPIRSDQSDRPLNTEH